MPSLSSGLFLLAVPDGHTSFYPVFITAVVAAGIALGILIFSHFVGPRRSSPVKSDRYECGVEPKIKPDAPFSVKFFRFALLFILLDVDVLLFYPWIVGGRQGDFPYFYLALGIFAFAGVLLAALAYAWRKGALEWD